VKGVQELLKLDPVERYLLSDPEVARHATEPSSALFLKQLDVGTQQLPRAGSAPYRLALCWPLGRLFRY